MFLSNLAVYTHANTVWQDWNVWYDWQDWFKMRLNTWVASSFWNVLCKTSLMVAYSYVLQYVECIFLIPRMYITEQGTGRRDDTFNPSACLCSSCCIKHPVRADYPAFMSYCMDQLWLVLVTLYMGKKTTSVSSQASLSHGSCSLCKPGKSQPVFYSLWQNCYSFFLMCKAELL